MKFIGGSGMVESKVSQNELQKEIADMLRVCFEGEVAEHQNLLLLQLPSGQSFRINVCEWSAE